MMVTCKWYNLILEYSRQLTEKLILIRELRKTFTLNKPKSRSLLHNWLKNILEGNVPFAIERKR